MPIEKQTSNISNNEYEELIKKNFSLEKNKEKSIVSGKIIHLDKENVIVDVGLKSEGRIPITEFIRPGQNPEVKVGDNIGQSFIKHKIRNNTTNLLTGRAVLCLWHGISIVCIE